MHGHHDHRFRMSPLVERPWGARGMNGVRTVARPIAVLVVLVLLGLVLWGLIVPGPRWIVHGKNLQPAELQKARDDVRTTLIQAVGGTALLLGLFFTARSARLSRVGQITDRFSKAITQIGDPEQAVRTGGLYAMERIARDSAADRRAVREILLRLVRDAGGSCDDPKAAMRPLSSDGQIALRILGRRSGSNWESMRLDLGEICLNGASLEGGNWQYADFAHTRMSRAEFMDAKCRRARFHNADLSGAFLSRADLRGAFLRAANLEGAFFTGANCRGADFMAADLSAAVFRNPAYKRFALRRSPFNRKTRLRNANFAHADLTGTNFRDVDLSKAKGLNIAQLMFADVCEHTRMPRGIRAVVDEAE